MADGASQWRYVSTRLLKNAILAIPGLARVDEKRHALRTGPMNDPEYVVGILSGHLRRWAQAGGASPLSDDVQAGARGLEGMRSLEGMRALELGPGNSLGQAFILCLLGAEQVTAVDVRRYATDETGKGIYRLLAAGLDDHLSSGRLPVVAIPPAARQERMAELLPPGADFPRIGGRLRYDLTDGKRIPLPDGSVDFIYSCSVLEHVRDLDQVYKEQARVLSPGGICSHIVDLKDHHHSDPFDFLRYSDRQWNWMQSRSAGYTNRVRGVEHLRLMESAGLTIVKAERRMAEQPPSRIRVAERFRAFSDEELQTKSVLVTARRG